MEIKGKIISFIGDSITEGVGATSNETRYTNLIAKKYGAEKMNNYGISGTRIARQQNTPTEWRASFDIDFCMRAPLIDKKSDIIVVFGGTNDYGHGDAPIGTMDDRTPDTFYGACHCLMHTLVNDFPSAKTVICTPLHRETENEPCSRGLVLLDFVNIIKEVAEFYSLPVCDLWSISGIVPADPQNKREFCPDGLHPNDAGHMLIAEKISNFISEL